ncbi:MAG: hypothetical protein NT041_01665, partial [Candidatus Vogelbacteria bacterium]|nr:hypothetical protein [Candidatus Vogelbacteria bacterium]
MDISQLVKNSPLYPILILESALSSRARSLLIKISGSLFAILVVVAAFFSFSGLATLAPKVWGLIFISLAFFLMAKMIEFYFICSYYFGNVALNRYEPGDIFTFTVGRILLSVRNNDVLEGFLLSSIGRQVIKRCGLSDRATNEFLNKRGPAVFYKLPLNPDEVLKLRDLVKFLFTNDSVFANWLAEAGINEAELIGAVGWVVYAIEYGE